MTLNGSGIRDTARVLEISPTTVINELKKRPRIAGRELRFFAIHRHDQIVVDIVKVEDNSDVSRQDTSVEMDEMWSYIGCKDNQRWLWHAVDRITGKVLAYVLGRRRDEVFLKLKDLLELFGITRFYTDDWGAYKRHLDPEPHVIGKQNTQKIERKHLTLRMRIKRLARKSICF